METSVINNKVVSRDDWLEARRALLIREKEFTQQRDELSAQRRALPWVLVEKDYAFDTKTGGQTLSELFEGRSQLLIYHFMMGPDWEQGCKSCSFWADSFDGIDVHLAHRDVTFIAMSRAPLAKLEDFRKRMGWSFNWVSSAPSNFNLDYQVSFDPGQTRAGEAIYNYQPLTFETDEMPGISAFYRNETGEVFHTYSTYSRGLDLMNAAYNYLDLTPKGRDEDMLDGTMAWVKHHDRY